jgi:23S rRNA pseudouridine2605 synthase
MLNGIRLQPNDPTGSRRSWRLSWTGMSGKSRSKIRSPGEPSRNRGEPSPNRGGPSRSPDEPVQERLQKVLAAAGLGSRRQCETLIEDGRVQVDSQVVTQLGTKVDPSCQTIRVDGEPIRQSRRVYYAVNKPPGVVSTNRDPAGRSRVIDLVPADAGRLYSVGRLDTASQGLILVTNDGQLTNQLTHPRFGVEKTYLVEVAGHLDREVCGQLRRGIHLAEGVARAVRVRIKRRRKLSTILEMVLDEGRNREIRRVLAKVDHKVLRLERIAVGPVRLGDLPSGAFRLLTRVELRALRNASGQGRAGGQSRGDPQRRRKHRKKGPVG